MEAYFVLTASGPGGMAGDSPIRLMVHFTSPVVREEDSENKDKGEDRAFHTVPGMEHRSIGTA